MQNVGGLWGKVKSQAQAAGSMAQGAINVSLLLFPHSVVPGSSSIGNETDDGLVEWFSASCDGRIRVDAVFLPSWGIPKGCQDPTTLPWLVLSRLPDWNVRRDTDGELNVCSEPI